MKIPPASELTLPSVQWLWPGHLALDNLALLDGDPGLGKSFITLDLAARITTGRPFPDGAPGGAPAPVLLICAEDMPGIIVARLRGLGADLSRVYLWPRDSDGGLPVFPTDWKRLDAVLDHIQPRYVVLDPIMSFLGRRVNLANDASVRTVLDALAQRAAHHHCVIQLLRHLNKRTGQPSLYRGGGSIAFIAASRLAWLAAQHPRQPDHCVLAQNKNNYAPLQPSLLYSVAAGVPDGGSKMENGGLKMEDRESNLEPAPGTASDPPFSILHPQSSILHPQTSIVAPSPTMPARIVWHGPCPLPAAVLAARRPSPALLRAIAFLKDALRDGPRPSREVHDAAKRQGISYGTLRRAKDLLFIESPRRYDNGRPVAYYKFPHQRLPPSPGCELADAWLEERAEEWRKEAG